MFPSVTLYILNHNYAEYIADAVDSALRQDHGDFGLIIIDDGSADDSREKINVIYQANKGLTAPANVAPKPARGK